MINLEDIDTKENLIQDFYRWLFDNNNVVDKSVILEKEVDISLAPYYIIATIVLSTGFENIPK